ncbi:1198_t:CDS:1 [Diversispora eburnea]|uniref:1198_t:CDS:1 n=1 Tax=Diversispora eburnea TaxID=1213867 RepID=A0A9N9AK63_9GLOM|nr:1198_t:CDS:1 [Diversispora eburnea]
MSQQQSEEYNKKIFIKKPILGKINKFKSGEEKLIWSAYTHWKDSNKKIWSELLDYYFKLDFLDKAIIMLNDFKQIQQKPGKLTILDFFKERISLGLIPSNSICNEAIYKSSNTQEMMSLYKLLKSCNCEFKRKVYDLMLQVTLKEKEIQLLDIFYRDFIKLDTEELNQDAKNYLQVIENTFIENKPKQAINKFMEISSLNIQSHPVIILTIFQGLFGYQEFEMAYEFFVKIKEKDIKITLELGNYLCMAFLYNNYLRYVEKIIHNMITTKVVPSNFVFEELARVYLSKGLIDSAEMMIKYLKSKNGSYTIFLNQLVDHYIKLKKFKSLEKWVGELEMAPPSLKTRSKCINDTILLNVYGVLCKEMEFYRLWTKMKNEYEMEDLGAGISLVIDHLGFSGDIHKLKHEWKTLCSNPQIKLNLNHYNSYIEALCRCKEFDQAAYVFLIDFIKKNIVPGLRTLLAIIPPLRNANKKLIESNLLKFVEENWPETYKEFQEFDICELNLKNRKFHKFG